MKQFVAVYLFRTPVVTRVVATCSQVEKEDHSHIKFGTHNNTYIRS